MSILLIRHGETALNVARTLQPADTPLSARGVMQAEALAQRLARLGGIAAVLSSDLPRALRTAQAVAAATGAPLQTSALLHERNYGALRGQPYDTLGFDPLTLEAAPVDGESGETFRRRVAAAFAAAVALHESLGGHLAVVTHGLVIREMLSSQTRLGAGFALPASIGNTSLSIIAAVPPHGVELIDCMVHLDTDVARGAGSGSGLSGG